jgi:hypothetical protein
MQDVAVVDDIRALDTGRVDPAAVGGYLIKPN